MGWKVGVYTHLCWLCSGLRECLEISLFGFQKWRWYVVFQSVQLLLNLICVLSLHYICEAFKSFFSFFLFFIYLVHREDKFSSSKW